MIRFEKRAGLILDQQDDPGAGWEEIAPFWPDDLVPPDLGVEMDKRACAVELSPDGHEKIARYPIDSPTNALASSMYFLAFGTSAIDPEHHVKIAERLQEARIMYGAHLPQEFVVSLMSKQAAEVTEIYADDDEHLPVTTPEQTQASIDLFSKHAEAWNSADRMILSSRLEKAAEYHGIEAELPYAKKTISKHAHHAIESRVRIMEGLTPGMTKEASADVVDYCDGLHDILVRLDSTDSYMDIVKIAEDLEALDRSVGLDEGWDVHFPDPVNSVLFGTDLTLFKEIDKEASWGEVDWNGLRGTFSDDVVEAISSDPDTVIPTLPTPQRKLVEDYINERK